MSVSSELSKARERLSLVMSNDNFDGYVEELEAKGVTGDHIAEAMKGVIRYANGGSKVTPNTVIEAAYRVHARRPDWDPLTPASQQIVDAQGALLTDKESLVRVQKILDRLKKRV